MTDGFLLCILDLWDLMFLVPSGCSFTHGDISSVPTENRIRKSGSSTSSIDKSFYYQSPSSRRVTSFPFCRQHILPQFPRLMEPPSSQLSSGANEYAEIPDLATITMKSQNTLFSSPNILSGKVKRPENAKSISAAACRT
jgi:hypothetical protein